MTPQEKAEELVGKFYFQVDSLNKQKQCALIAVDEILNVLPQIERIYWKDVKQEIEKL